MKYNTIHTIIDDIMLEMRRNNVTESESYSRKQIEQWIIQYRAMHLKELSNQKLPIASEFYQSFIVELTPVATARAGDLAVGSLESDVKIPDIFSNDIGLRYITSYDMLGNEIQVMSRKRANSVKHSRYSRNLVPAAYIGSNKKYYIDNADHIENVEISLIAIDPTEVPGFDYENDLYPIDVSSLPKIKQLIFQNELKYNLIPDTKNDGREEFAVSSK